MEGKVQLVVIWLTSACQDCTPNPRFGDHSSWNPEDYMSSCYMSYSLNSVKGGYTGDDIGNYYGGY